MQNLAGHTKVKNKVLFDCHLRHQFAKFIASYNIQCVQHDNHIIIGVHEKNLTKVP